jgi:rubrerythrin
LHNFVRTVRDKGHRTDSEEPNVNKKTQELPVLTEEQQEEQRRMIEEILHELRTETPEQTAQRERERFERFYTMLDEDFWEFQNTGGAWEEAMCRAVVQGVISDAEILSWFGAHDCGFDPLVEFRDSHPLTGFGCITNKISRRAAKRLLKALRTGVPCAWTPLPPRWWGKWRCQECGECLLWETNGLTLRPSPLQAPCAYPGGFKEFHTELSVPSGRLAMSDYFPEVDVAYEREKIGRTKQTERYRSQDYNAKHQGFATMGVCGNSCPGFWGTESRDHFVVGNGVNDPQDWRKDIVLPLEGGTQIGGISTGAWEYALVDAYYLDAQGGTSSAERIVDVKPGVYRVSHHGHYIDRDDFKKPRVFAELVWVRDC